MPIGLNGAGCNSCPTQTGFEQDNFQEINVTAFSNPATSTDVSQQIQKMY